MEQGDKTETPTENIANEATSEAEKSNEPRLEPGSESTNGQNSKQKRNPPSTGLLKELLNAKH